MYRSISLIGLMLLSMDFFTSIQLRAQENEGEIIILSEKVGEVIDSTECRAYGLLPQINGFQSAVVKKISSDKYVFEIRYIDKDTDKEELIRIYRTELQIKQLGNMIDQFGISPPEIEMENEEENGQTVNIKITGGHLNTGLSMSRVAHNLAEREGIGTAAYNPRVGFTFFLEKRFGMGLEWEYAGFQDKRKFEVELMSGETRKSHVTGSFLSFFVSLQSPYLQDYGIPVTPYFRLGYEGNWIQRTPKTHGNEVILDAPEEKINLKKYGLFLEPAIYFAVKEFCGITVSYRYYFFDPDLVHKIMLDWSFLIFDLFT